MTHIVLTALLLSGGAGFAQEVQFDYDRSASFNAYKTYQWVDCQRGRTSATSSWIRISSAPWTSNSPVRVCGERKAAVTCMSVIRQPSHRRSSLMASAGVVRAGGVVGATEQLPLRRSTSGNLRSGYSTQLRSNSYGADRRRRRSISKRIPKRTIATSRKPWRSCSRTIPLGASERQREWKDREGILTCLKIFAR